MLDQRFTFLSLLALTAFAGAQDADAQSTVRPIPRLTRSELSLYSLAPELVRQPRASWAELEAGANGVAQDENELALRGSAVLMDGSNYSNAEGAVETQRGGWDVLFARDMGDDGLLAIGLETEASFYDFSGPGFAGVGDPFNDVYRSQLRSTAFLPVDDTLSIFSGAELTLAGEDEAVLADGITAGGAFGVGYRASDRLEVSFGLAGATRLEDRGYLLPFLGIDWELTDSTRLVAEGPLVRLENDLSDRWELNLEASYDQRQYRLNERGQGGPLDGAAFRDEQIDLSGELVWTPGDNWRIGATAGVTAWRELTVQRDSEQVAVTEVDPAPFFGVSLSARF